MRPPLQVTEPPERDCVQPGFASASSRSNPAGTRSVTWSMPIASSSLGAPNVRSIASPTLTRVGETERCAQADGAKTSPLKTEMRGNDHALNLIRAPSDLEDLLVAVDPRDRVFVHEAVAAVDLQRP